MIELEVVFITGPQEKGLISEVTEIAGASHAIVSNLADIWSLSKNVGPDILVFDLDNVHIEDGDVKKIRRVFPEAALLVLSSRPCHPELKDSLGRHIFACLSLPLDIEEYSFCLRSISEKKATLALGHPESLGPE